jgi:hypothetical protein
MVTLVESGPDGSGSNVQANLIVVLTPFQNWQLLYFHCINCPQAAADADPDGDGFTNLEEFQAGTDPTIPNSSPLQITATAQQGMDILLTWTTPEGRTRVVLATAGPSSSHFSNFTDLSPIIVPNGDGLTSTHHLDAGGAPNTPPRSSSPSHLFDVDTADNRQQGASPLRLHWLVLNRVRFRSTRQPLTPASARLMFHWIFESLLVFSAACNSPSLRPVSIRVASFGTALRA